MSALDKRSDYDGHDAISSWWIPGNSLHLRFHVFLKPDVSGRIRKLKITGKRPGRSRFGSRGGTPLSLPPLPEVGAGMGSEPSRAKIDSRRRIN